MDVFDILGPVMIGPSSSHTAGAARIGWIAQALLGAPAVKVEILLHGSFAKTYKGHGTDKALVAGVLGMKPDDPRLKESLALAQQAKIAVTVSTGYLENAHPNTARIRLEDAQGNRIQVEGASVGGGSILITRVNGMEVSFSGQYTTLIILHRDAPGTIAAVTSYMGELGVNICNFRLAREQKGGTAVMTIEMDGSIGREVNEQIKQLPNIIGSTMLLPN